MEESDNFCRQNLCIRMAAAQNCRRAEARRGGELKVAHSTPHLRVIHAPITPDSLARYALLLQAATISFGLSRFIAFARSAYAASMLFEWYISLYLCIWVSPLFGVLYRACATVLTNEPTGADRTAPLPAI